MRIKRIIYDIFLNSFSNFMLIGVLQLLIFPYFNSIFDINYFGEITALYGLNSILLVFLGDSINNLKILYQNNHKDDFYQLSKIVVVITIILSCVIFKLYSSESSFIDLLIFALATSMGVYRLYLGAEFRIKLNFKKILFSNFFVLIGYSMGFVIFYFTHIWSLIFLVGEILGIIYLSLKREQLIIRRELNNFPDNKLVKDYIRLSLTYGINGVGNYLDRLLIIPILGAASMSIFYSASVFAKIITMILGQINTVLLSYIMKDTQNFNKKKILKSEFYLLLIMFILAYPLVLISNIFVKILYPELFFEAIKIIPMITIGVLFYSVSNFTKIIILKYYNLNIQLNIQLAYTILYFILAIYLSNQFGVLGFSYAYCFMGICSFILYFCVILFAKVKEKDL